MNSTEQQHRLYAEYLKSETHRENLKRLGLAKAGLGIYDPTGDMDCDLGGRPIIPAKKANAGRA